MTMNRSSRWLALTSVAIYVSLVVLVLLGTLRKTHGHFVYVLDDPYIHLALSEQLAHGHYGINAGEFSSPSSSLLWPFLLVPFAGTALHALVPFSWNFLCGAASAFLIGWVVATRQAPVMPRRQQLATVILLLFAANLVSLTFVGMEHGLQVLLAILCVFGLLEALAERPIPPYCLVAAAIAPMVRYEDLALTLAVAIALVGQHRWKRAIALLASSLVPLVAFAAFLHARGLPVLPVSVLVKGDAFASANPLVRIARLVGHDLYDDFRLSEHYPVLILFLIFAGLVWRERQRARRYVFAAAATVAGLQLLVGRFGWYYRYEVYAVIFLTLLLLHILMEDYNLSFVPLVLGLMFIASPYIEATAGVPEAASEVYLQQYQMHRWMHDFYHGDVAVNDLGLVSFQRQPKTYVLDVFGLASVEAARQKNKSAAWLAGIVQRHNVDLAIIYPEWFKIPLSWKPLAKLCLPSRPVVVAGQCVVFYSTSSRQEDVLHNELERFAQTLPKEDAFYWGELPNEEFMWRPLREAAAAGQNR